MAMATIRRFGCHTIPRCLRMHAIGLLVDLLRKPILVGNVTAAMLYVHAMQFA
jgi:hypothetical protein